MLNTCVHHKAKAIYDNWYADIRILYNINCASVYARHQVISNTAYVFMYATMGNNMKQRALNLRRSIKAYLYPLACQNYYDLSVCYDTKHYTTAMLHMLCIATYMQKEYRAYMLFRVWYFCIPHDS